MNDISFLVRENLIDPVMRAAVRNGCQMRTYQSEALRIIFDGVEAGKGGSYAVTFPRQSGKNETQAQLESAVMAANLYRGGNIIKVIPTLKNQGEISTDRLISVLRGSTEKSEIRNQKSEIVTGDFCPVAGEGETRKFGNQNPENSGVSKQDSGARIQDSGNSEFRNQNSEIRDTGTVRACPDSGTPGTVPCVPRPAADTPHSSPLTPHSMDALHSAATPHSSLLTPHSRKGQISYGRSSLRCLSAGPNSSIVGATADLMLEVDEAQLVPAEKFDMEAAPMAASVNAVRVFWGTVWDDQTLLAREVRSAQREEERSGRKHVFRTTAAEVGHEVPAYASYVRGEIERFGREHPAVRTQFFCEEISDITAMFTPDRIEKIKGNHRPQERPEDPESCYVFLIDIAGSDEITPASRRANGFSDRRDATVLTICKVTLPETAKYTPNNFVWHVLARRLYRNLPTERLEQEICREVECWDPNKIILDHSGLGAMLSGTLSARWPRKCRPVDITASNKTKMAWDFLAMVETRRWIEYRTDEMEVMPSGFRPGKEPFEILRDPALLQQMFFRELRACRIEPLSTALNVRWGVKDGTRDPLTGRLIHDDLVMSAALAVFEEGDLPLGWSNDLPVPQPFWPDIKW